MSGSKDSIRLSLQKQALVLESNLNRLKLQTELEKLRSSSARLAGVGRKGAPLLLLLAPVAGFFIARKGRRSSSGPSAPSWFGHVSSALKLVGPAIALWRSYSERKKKEKAGHGGEEKP